MQKSKLKDSKNKQLRLKKKDNDFSWRVWKMARSVPGSCQSGPQAVSSDSTELRFIFSLHLLQTILMHLMSVIFLLWNSWAVWECCFRTPKDQSNCPGLTRIEILKQGNRSSLIKECAQIIHPGFKFPEIIIWVLRQPLQKLLKSFIYIYIYIYKIPTHYGPLILYEFDQVFEKSWLCHWDTLLTQISPDTGQLFALCRIQGKTVASC